MLKFIIWPYGVFWMDQRIGWGWTETFLWTCRQCHVPLIRATDNIFSFDTARSAETLRMQLIILFYFFISPAKVCTLWPPMLFHIICCCRWLSSRSLIGAHGSFPFSLSLKHTGSDWDAGWTLAHTRETETRVNISFQQYVYTHCYQEFSHTWIAPFSPFLSLCKVTMSDSIHGFLLSVLVSPSHPRGSRHSSPFLLSFVLSHFIPMLHSNWVRTFFFLPPLPSPHRGWQRPTGTYLVSVFIPTACLWPAGKLQSVICLQVHRNLLFSSSLALTFKERHHSVDLRREGLVGSASCVLFSICWGHTLPSYQEEIKTISLCHKLL